MEHLGNLWMFCEQYLLFTLGVLQPVLLLLAAQRQRCQPVSQPFFFSIRYGHINICSKFRK